MHDMHGVDMWQVYMCVNVCDVHNVGICVCVVWVCAVYVLLNVVYVHALCL